MKTKARELALSMIVLLLIVPPVCFIATHLYSLLLSIGFLGGIFVGVHLYQPQPPIPNHTPNEAQ